MEWVERLNQSMNYIEEHLTGDIDYEQLGRIACCSTHHYQRMFSYMAGIALAEYIRGWGEGLAVEEEKYIGWRFIGTPRKLDIVIMNPQNCRSMAIEAKLQETSGSAFEKLSYALDDCMAAPIPSIIVFSGRYIRDDMKAKLISSGHGIEVGYENGAIADRYELLKQRIYIELGMNYFPFLRP